MLDKELLDTKIKDTGMTVSAIAEKSGILRETLYNRLKNGDFKASEIASLTKILGLTKKERDNIFFAKDVN